MGVALHALIELQTPPVDTGKRYEFPGTPPDLAGKSKPLRWVPVVDAPDPTFDPDVEKLERAPDAVTATEVTRSRVVVALSAEELEGVARRKKLATAGGAVATLRTWATQAQGTTVTQGNAVATLQTVVNRLGVFFDRFADLLEGQYVDK